MEERYLILTYKALTCAGEREVMPSISKIVGMYVQAFNIGWLVNLHDAVTNRVAPPISCQMSDGMEVREKSPMYSDSECLFDKDGYSNTSGLGRSGSIRYRDRSLR